MVERVDLNALKTFVAVNRIEVNAVHPYCIIQAEIVW